MSIPGEAQKQGYVNRQNYRQSKYEDKRRPFNTSLKTYHANYQMIGGGSPLEGMIPVPPKSILRRRKLKGWQKNLK
jgi:hypothetical protein